MICVLSGFVAACSAVEEPDCEAGQTISLVEKMAKEY